MVSVSHDTHIALIYYPDNRTNVRYSEVVGKIRKEKLIIARWAVRDGDVLELSVLVEKTPC